VNYLCYITIRDYVVTLWHYLSCYSMFSGFQVSCCVFDISFVTYSRLIVVTGQKQHGEETGSGWQTVWGGNMDKRLSPCHPLVHTALRRIATHLLWTNVKTTLKIWSWNPRLTSQELVRLVCIFTCVRVCGTSYSHQSCDIIGSESGLWWWWCWGLLYVMLS